VQLEQQIQLQGIPPELIGVQAFAARSDRMCEHNVLNKGDCNRTVVSSQGRGPGTGVRRTPGRYDLAKVAVNRLAFSLGHELGHELKASNGTAVAVTPGFLRSEMMLDTCGVTEHNCRNGQPLTAPGVGVSDDLARHVPLDTYRDGLYRSSGLLSRVEVGLIGRTATG
jgi:NAD(P)-dependent dehydrogenase (short-subunit alcohol dehydrogenase family)